MALWARLNCLPSSHRIASHHIDVVGFKKKYFSSFLFTHSLFFSLFTISLPFNNNIYRAMHYDALSTLSLKWVWVWVWRRCFGRGFFRNRKQLQCSDFSPEQKIDEAQTHLVVKISNCCGCCLVLVDTFAPQLLPYFVFLFHSIAACTQQLLNGQYDDLQM